MPPAQQLMGFAITAAMILGVAQGCDPAEACRKTPLCRRLGKCTAKEGGACVVGSDQDCRSSDECRVTGKCAMKDGACVAKTDDGCKASENCQKAEVCEAYEGTCVSLAKSFHTACSKSCATEGPVRAERREVRRALQATLRTCQRGQTGT
jgi:hypothetical protein